MMIRSMLFLSLCFALGGAGCAAEIASEQDPVEFEPGGVMIASVEHGESTIDFVDLGDGSVAIVQHAPLNAVPLAALVRGQGGTPLDLYVTLTGENRQEAPAVLLEDHYRRVERAPVELDLEPPPELASVAELTQRDDQDLPEDLARALFDLNVACSPSAMANYHAWIMALSGRTKVVIDANLENSIKTTFSTPLHLADFHFSTCGKADLHSAAVGYRFKLEGAVTQADGAAKVKKNQMYIFSHFQDGLVRQWWGNAEGGFPEGSFAMLATRMW